MQCVTDITDAEVRHLKDYADKHPGRQWLSDAEFEAQIVKQGNLCPIGKHPFTRGRGRGKHSPCSDHNHVNGLTRGILCNQHNLALGGFHDSPQELQDAIAYLNLYPDKG